MNIVEIPVSDIKVRFRLRTPSQEKIDELSHSISSCGLLNPIILDNSHNLIAGNHRLEAFKQLKRHKIPSIIKESNEQMAELMEIEENYARNELNLIEIADHIVKREDLLEGLGLKTSIGDNQYSEKMTVSDLADGLGISKRTYQQRKQISKLHPEVKSQLVSSEYANNLVDLIKLSSEAEDVQKYVCELLMSGRCKTFKAAFIQAKYKEFRLRSKPKFDFDFKERFGDYPQSIMKFQHKDNDLRRVCNLVNHNENLRVQKGSLNFGETQIKLHQMNPSHCEFALDYYTKENDLVLDMFCGRATTAITALHLNRRFIGFHIDEYAYKESIRVIEDHIETSKDRWEMVLGDGCEMDYLKNESACIDAIFSSPPYYGSPEPYNDLPQDLGNMSIEDFDKRMEVCFKNIDRLIKRSDHKNKIFHPIIFTIGTYRKLENGIYDMDFSFQKMAKDLNWKLWDKMHIPTVNPHLVCSIQRNYELGYVHKNYETQLVFVKF